MTSTDATRRPRRRRFPFVRLIAAFLVGIVLAGALGAGALYAYDNHYAARVLPGVSVGPVDLSGLDRAAARARLAQAYAAFGQGRLVVRLADEETAIGYAELGRAPDLDTMLDEAFGVGRTDSTLQRVVHEMRLLTTGTVLMPRMTFEPSTVIERITEIARANEWRAVDAKTIRTETGFSTAAGKLGQRVNESAAILEAITALTRATAPSEVVVTLETIAIEPSITTAEAEFGSRAGRRDGAARDGPDRRRVLDHPREGDPSRNQLQAHRGHDQPGREREGDPRRRQAARQGHRARRGGCDLHLQQVHREVQRRQVPGGPHVRPGQDGRGRVRGRERPILVGAARARGTRPHRGQA